MHAYVTNVTDLGRNIGGPYRSEPDASDISTVPLPSPATGSPLTHLLPSGLAHPTDDHPGSRSGSTPACVRLCRCPAFMTPGDGTQGPRPPPLPLETPHLPEAQRARSTLHLPAPGHPPESPSEPACNRLASRLSSPATARRWTAHGISTSRPGPLLLLGSRAPPDHATDIHASRHPARAELQPPSPAGHPALHDRPTGPLLGGPHLPSRQHPATSRRSPTSRPHHLPTSLLVGGLPSASRRAIPARFFCPVPPHDPASAIHARRLRLGLPRSRRLRSRCITSTLGWVRGLDHRPGPVPASNSGTPPHSGVPSPPATSSRPRHPHSASSAANHRRKKRGNHFVSNGPITARHAAGLKQAARA